MAVETFKVIDTGGKKSIVSEIIPPELLEGQLGGGWALTPEDAKKKFKEANKN